jgi:hypothetical protein
MAFRVSGEGRPQRLGRDVAQRDWWRIVVAAGEQLSDRGEVLAVRLERVRRWLARATVGEEVGEPFWVIRSASVVVVWRTASFSWITAGIHERAV